VRDSLVIDSSVAGKWYLPENGSDRAALLLRAGLYLIAPDLLIAEIGNVLWKRRREVPAIEIEAIAVALTSACPVALYSSTALLRGALAVALAYDRSVYDSLYLALAVSEGCALVTADERLCNALQNTDLAAYLRLL
jgi:predicted nucleic acid-binding protein